MSNDVTELKNAPPPVIEQKIELPYIPNIDENEFEDMKYNIRQLKSKSIVTSSRELQAR